MWSASQTVSSDWETLRAWYERGNVYICLLYLSRRKTHLGVCLTVFLRECALLQSANGDLNNDAIINVTDVILLVNIILGL